MTKTNTKQRKQYTQAFKDSAVRLAEESGRGATSVARDLGIPVEYLYRWRAAKRGVNTVVKSAQIALGCKSTDTQYHGEISSILLYITGYLC